MKRPVLPAAHHKDIYPHSVVPCMQYSLAVVQPDIPSSQPGSVVLVLIGYKVVDQSRDSGFEGVSVLVGAISKQCGSVDINIQQNKSVYLITEQPNKSGSEGSSHIVLMKKMRRQCFLRSYNEHMTKCSSVLHETHISAPALLSHIKSSVCEACTVLCESLMHD